MVVFAGIARCQSRSSCVRNTKEKTSLGKKFLLAAEVLVRRIFLSIQRRLQEKFYDMRIMCRTIVFLAVQVACSSTSHAFSQLPKRTSLASNHATNACSRTASIMSSLAAPNAAKLSAAERYFGAGEATVDMNRYNIPVEQAAEEWKAVLSAGTAMIEAGVYLDVKSSRNYFVDTLKFEIKRAGGMGIELLELAGGRSDGLGITMVSGLIEGSNADGSGILPGDSISQFEVVKSESRGNTQTEEAASVSVECLGYDATIEAIMSLPEVSSDDETVLLTIKRIRRKPRVTVKLQYPPSQNEPDSTIELFAGENLRRAMLTRGIKLNDKLSERFDSGGLGDCGADGTCATCVVGVTKGEELLDPKKIQEEQILKKNPRWRMACKTVVGHGMTEGEMTIQVNPRQWDQ